MEPVWFSLEYRNKERLLVREARIQATELAQRIQEAGRGKWERQGKQDWLICHDLQEPERKGGAVTLVATPPQGLPVTEFLREFGLTDLVRNETSRVEPDLEP